MYPVERDLMVSILVNNVPWQPEEPTVSWGVLSTVWLTV